jgi:hypothetical protein
MVNKDFSKENGSAEKPKKPFFSKGGCIGAIIFLTLIIITILPNPNYRKKGYDAAAQADVRNAFTAAMAYFKDYPNGTISLPKLTSYGFVQSSNNVILAVVSGSQSNLKITAFHTKGTKTYAIDSDGNMSSQKR